MCGRRTLINSKESIVEELKIDEWSIKDYKPSYNIAPTHQSPVLITANGKRIATLMKWGLIPAWSKSDSFASKMINARSESITEKSSYKNLIFQNRCIIISNGYYEWSKKEENKEPYYFYNKNSLILFAGLWTSWKRSSKIINTYTIITATAYSEIKHIHNRMPLIIDPLNADEWLVGDSKKFNFNDYLKSHHNYKKLNYVQVSSFVNSVTNNSIKCISPFKKPLTIEIFK